MLAEPRKASSDEIPVLDLSKAATASGRQDLAAELRRACLSLGFFYIRDHGVGQAQIDESFAVTRRYFALPLEERLLCSIDDQYRRGYMPMYATKIGTVADMRESFDMGLDLPLNDPDVVAGKFMYGPNRWPEGRPWFRKTMEEYNARLMDVSRIMLHLFALSLEVDEAYFLRYFNKPMMHTRLFHYPSQSPRSADDEYGIAPHTDIGFITILNQDSVGGLEVRTRSGEWIGAPYIPGSFIVNLGNLFRRWTNDLYVSNPHRVINRSGQARYSIPTFLNLDYDTPVECVPTCRATDGSAKYETVSAGFIVENALKRFELKDAVPAPVYPHEAVQ